MQYLAALRPEPGLLGANERERADVARWLLWDAAHLSRHVGAIMFEKFVKGLFKMGPPDETVIKTAQEQVKRFYGVLDSCLKGKTYLAGERLTIADLSVACTLTYPDLVGVPLGDYPNIRAWLARISALDAWKKTAPKLPAAAAE
jgi:glutathione S-transferase